MDKKVFGNFIKEKRIEKNLTQKELAECLLIDTTAVSKWERGVSYPDITMIPDICKVLDVSEKELIESSTDNDYRNMKRESRKYNKIKNVVFYSFSTCYLIAVLTCFIVNLAVSHTLSWFFIVFSGCLCGFCFIPSITRFFRKYKLSVYLGSSLLSLIILYVTCSIYTSNYWCYFAILATILGYLIICYTILFSKQKAYLNENDYEKIKKFFLISYTVTIYILTSLMLLLICRYTKTSFVFSFKILSGCYWIVIVFGLVRLLNLKVFVRLGIDFIFLSIYFLFINGFLNHMLDPLKEGCYKINFSDWSNCSDGNICLIIVITSLLLSCFFFILSKHKKKTLS